MKKSLRVGMVCLLVLALLLYLSPVRVSAMALPEVVEVSAKIIPFAEVVEVPALGAASTAFGWVLLGLGLACSAQRAYELMTDYAEWSGELGMAMYYYPDGTWSYGVDMGFIERVHAFLWAKGIIVKNTELELDSAAYPTAEMLAEARAANYAVLVYYRYNGGSLRFHLAYSNESQIEVRTSSGLTIKTVDTGAYIYLWQDSTQKFQRHKTTAASGSSLYVAESVQHFGQLIIPDVRVTIDGVELGVVADPATEEQPLEWQTGPYREWYANKQAARDPETGKDVQVLPIPYNPVEPGGVPDSATQPDVWQGAISDPVSGLKPVPDGSLAETPWEGVQDWLTPSGEPGQFGIQLRDYFPFCIPFDLYDFLTVLAAEPEAPCFVWEVPVPQMGRTFTVEVDLSPWDSVAALFRKLELLAFIVGLGWVTREKIRG